jgi:hypothetical protein
MLWPDTLTMAVTEPEGELMIDYALIFYIGLALFIGNCLRIIWQSYKDQNAFIAWLEKSHPEEFRRLVYEEGSRKFFSPPWRRDTIAYFIGSSEEDFGDPKIQEFRTKLRWDLYSFLIGAVATVVYFVMLAIWLEYVVKP